MIKSKKKFWLTGIAPYYPAAVGGGYTGPGDVATGAVAWHGLRGYNAAYATGSNPAVDLVDQAGVNAITINIKANGDLDVGAISTWVTAHSVTTILVTKLYDQTGNAHHLSQGTLANMPALGLNVINVTKPAILAASSKTLQISVGVTQTQPYTLSAVAERTTSGGAANAGIYGAHTINGALIFETAANNAGLYAGSVSAGVTANDNVAHAFLGVFNGSSSTLAVDGGAATTGLVAGSAAFSNIGLAININGFTYTGYFFEGGLWGGSSVPSLFSNQSAYWGV